MSARSVAALAHSRFANRYDGAVAAQRHALYLSVRDHLKAGWSDLPTGLTHDNLNDLAVMARARVDTRIAALCRAAALRASEAS